MKLILVVDDDPLILKMWFDRLSNEGYQLLQAKNGQEGLGLALSNHPDLIILDIVMPVMDGITMLKALRQDTWGKEVPVIILSSQQDSKNISDALAYQVFHYVVKTNDTEKVVESIHDLLKDK